MLSFRLCAPPAVSKQTTPLHSHYFSHTNVTIYKEDILAINNIPSSSVDLIVTSPPYNVDIHYHSHQDNVSYDEYLKFTKKVAQKNAISLPKMTGDSA